jgi:hypothetical protein
MHFTRTRPVKGNCYTYMHYFYLQMKLEEDGLKWVFVFVLNTSFVCKTLTAHVP